MNKRFYKAVELAAEEGGFAVLLDGRPLPSTSRRRLLLPSQALADAVAAEWRAQGDRIDPLSMPLTRLANTGIDRVAPERPRYIAEILRFAETDALAYWAPEPAELVARQEAEWRPLLAWFAGEVGRPLAVTSGIAALPQDPEVARVLAARLERRSDLALAGLQTLTAVTGSAVVALALDAGRIGPEEGFRAAHLDELYQAEIWGSDAEAERRRRDIAEDIAQTVRFLILLEGR